MATNEETVYNKNAANNCEDTQLVDKQEKKEETTDGKKEKTSWKKVTIGGVTGVLLGASSVFLTGSANATTDSETPDNTGDGNSHPHEESTPISPDSHVTVEGLSVATVNDDMSFNEAFAAARAEVGAGGVFEWHGGVYGTYYANEWDAMTPEQKTEFGSHLSYGHTPIATAESHHTTTVEEQTSIQQNEPEIVEVDTHGDSDVQILGVEDVTFEDGSVGTIAQANIEGADVYFVDIDHDGVFDVITSDLNNDGTINENEIQDIHDQGLMVSDFGGAVDMTDPSHNQYANLPDYINDADTSGLA